MSGIQVNKPESVISEQVNKPESVISEQVNKPELVRKDTRKRTCVKAIGWRIIATIITISISLLYIGDLSLALKIGAVDTIIKFALYYVYERMFVKIK